MTAETFSPGTKGIITNLVKHIRREQVEWWTSTFHGGRAFEVHCYATPIILYNLGKFSLTDEFFRAFATLILWKTFLGFHVVILVKTFPLLYQLPM